MSDLCLIVAWVQARHEVRLFPQAPRLPGASKVGGLCPLTQKDRNTEHQQHFKTLLFPAYLLIPLNSIGPTGRLIVGRTRKHIPPQSEGQLAVGGGKLLLTEELWNAKHISSTQGWERPV